MKVCADVHSDELVLVNTLNLSMSCHIFYANDLKNYRKKVEFYLKENKDELAIFKLRNNKKLNAKQIHFVKLIIDYVVVNGFIEDNRVLIEDSFSRVETKY